MKKRMIPMDLLFIMILLMCAVLYWNGNYVVYILSYIFSFTFLFCYVVFSAATIWEKIAQTIVYALIMAVQILSAVLVIVLTLRLLPYFEQLAELDLPCGKENGSYLRWYF